MVRNVVSSLVLVAAWAIPAGALAGGAIRIQSDADFASCGCVTGGSGSTGNPYIIGPLQVSHASGDGIFIDGTNLTKSFVLSNVTVNGSAGNGIVLNHINPSGAQTIVAQVSGVQTTINGNQIGIVVENSSYVTLEGMGENPSGPGVQQRNAGTIAKNAVGAVDVENSSHVTVKGWQLSSSGPDGSPDWVNFDPGLSHWAVGGVRFFGVTQSTIDHNAANNCTSVSFSFLNSAHNTLSNNTADYPFTTNLLITDGSAYNMVTGNVFSTADFIGLLIADPLPGSPTLAAYGPTHDNTVTGNTVHTDGPIGNELSPVDICPAFLGGIVVLNGTYNNQITNNTTWASFGADLVWAQAVPNSGSAIGVTTYAPPLNCNVSASEGGGGVGNFNGNVWSGNTYQHIATCIPAQ